MKGISVYLTGDEARAVELDAIANIVSYTEYLESDHDDQGKKRAQQNIDRYASIGYKIQKAQSSRPEPDIEHYIAYVIAEYGPIYGRKK